MFVIIGLAVSLRLGVSPWFMFITVFIAMIAFYTAHWQTYVTGTLKFGKIDVTEAQLCTYLIFATSGFLGDSLWSINVNYRWFLEFKMLFKYLNFFILKVPVLNLELRYFPVLFAMCATIFSILNNLSIISKGGKGKNGSSVAVRILFIYRKKFN